MSLAEATVGGLAAAEAALGPLTHDRLLGGRVGLTQPRQGYRAATDPVLLAAAVPAAGGETVLELGIGAGAAVLCLAARVPGLAFAGLEIQPGYAALARANAAAAGVALEVVEGDVAAMPAALRARRFDHVILNPPWYDHGVESGTRARTLAHEEGDAPLATWIAAAVARTRPRGHVAIIHRAERLDTILATLSGPCGAIRVRPLAARAGRAAGRVIVTARTQVRTPLTLEAPLVLHRGPRHPGDVEHLTACARAVIAGGLALDAAMALSDSDDARAPGCPDPQPPESA